MSWTSSQHRRLAAAFTSCSVLTLILLGSHPDGSGPRSLIDLLKSEAAERYRDGIVHGGFIVVTWIVVSCCALLSRELGLGRARVTAGLVAFCMGSAAMTASMTLDGLIVPALAGRLLGLEPAAGMAAASALFTFCGTAIRILMPLGLLFQVLGVTCWSAALGGFAGPGVRGIAAAGGITYVAALSALCTGLPGPGPQHLIIAGICLLCLWYLMIAVLLWRGAGGTPGGTSSIAASA